MQPAEAAEILPAREYGANIAKLPAGHGVMATAAILLPRPIIRETAVAFVCTFIGLTVALTAWATLYALLSSSDNPAVAALAPHVEAFSIGGWCLFIFLTVVASFLAYRLLKPKTPKP